MADNFDPYHRWLGIPPKDQPPHHYRLLGLGLFENDLDVIESAADRQMTHVRTFQSGRYSQQSQEILNTLSAAKICLLNVQQKADYDRGLQEKIDTQKPAKKLSPPAMPQTIPASYSPSPLAGIPFPATSVPPAVPLQAYQQPPAQRNPSGPPTFQIHDSAPAQPRRSATSLVVPMVAALALVLLSLIGWMVWSRMGQLKEEREVAKRNVDTPSDDVKRPVEPDQAKPQVEVNPAVEPNAPPKLAPAEPAPLKLAPADPAPPKPAPAEPAPPQPAVAVVDSPKQIPVPQPGAPLANEPPSPAIAPFDAPQAQAHQAAWAKHLKTEVETANSIGGKMVLLPPGEYLMGSTDEQVEAFCAKMKSDRARQPSTFAEVPQHRVVLTKSFCIGKTEVTVGQFKQFIEVTKYQTFAEKLGSGDSDATIKGKDLPEKEGLNWRSPGYDVTDESPVTQVTWNDAIEFCNWLSARENLKLCYGRTKSGWSLLPGKADGYRLPTEAEWEYACRAGTTSYYSFGDEIDALDQYAWYSSNSGRQSQPVGTKLPNAFGLHDMHGNVYEWCHDIYDAKWYANAPLNDPSGPATGSENVIRSGSFIWDPFAPRSACRESKSRPTRLGELGFRVARGFEIVLSDDNLRIAKLPADKSVAKKTRPADAKNNNVRYRDRGDFIEDTQTGLLWQKDGSESGKMNYYDAKTYAAGLNLGGLAGWRVPTRDELAAVFPAIDPPFTNTNYNSQPYGKGPGEWNSYWTADLDLRLNDYAYIYQWYANGGANNCFASKNFAYVRCVHGPVKK